MWSHLTKCTNEIDIYVLFFIVYLFSIWSWHMFFFFFTVILWPAYVILNQISVIDFRLNYIGSNIYYYKWKNISLI